MLSLYHKNIGWRQKFRPFAEFYRSDRPCYKPLKEELDLCPCYKPLEEELDLCKAYWLNDTSCHPDISSTLKSTDFKSFSNIKVCLGILGTLPVTTCTCEWSFSSMRRLKTYTYSAISGRSNGIALMHACSPGTCTWYGKGNRPFCSNK